MFCGDCSEALCYLLPTEGGLRLFFSTFEGDVLGTSNKYSGRIDVFQVDSFVQINEVGTGKWWFLKIGILNNCCFMNRNPYFEKPPNDEAMFASAYELNGFSALAIRLLQDPDRRMNSAISAEIGWANNQPVYTVGGRAGGLIEHLLASLIMLCHHPPRIQPNLF